MGSVLAFSGRAGSRAIASSAGVLLVMGLTVGVAQSASAALPAAPTVTGMTGSRPSATRLTFPISDQVSAGVDVATGNLEVAEQAFQLPGVVSPVPLTAAFNSMSQIVGSTGAPVANKWAISGASAGSLTLAPATGDVVFVGPDGSTWPFVPVAGSSTAFTSPAGLQATLLAQVTGGTVTGYTLTYWVSQVVVAFNTDGNPVTVTDRDSNVTTFSYDPYGVPTAVVSSAGPVNARTAALSYNASTYTETMTQTNGSLTRTVQYVKNSSSNLVGIVDAAGNTTAFTYTSGALTKIVSVTGAETDFSYDSAGRVAQVDQHNTTTGSPGTSTTRLTYPTSAQSLVAGPDTSTGTAVASGPHITYVIGAGYLVSKATDQMGRERSATYSTVNSAPLTSTSGNTDTTPPVGSTPTGTTTNTFGANSSQSLTSQAAPGGSAVTALYGNTAPGTAYLPSSTSSDSGDQTAYHYTGTGNLDTSTNSTLAATAALSYNANGTVATATAPLNAASANPTTYGYDGNSQLHTVTPPTGTSLGVKTLTYDGFGRLSTITDGAARTTTYTYDKIDRVLTTAFSDGTHTVTNTYNNAGQELTSVSASGTITNTYDQLGRLLTTVNTAGGGTETYSYDKASNLQTTTDSRGTVTTSFDSSGVPTTLSYPKGTGTQLTNFATDDQGRRTDQWMQTNPTNSAWSAHTHTAYDTTGRVTEQVGQAGPATTPVTEFDTSYCYNYSATHVTSCGTATANDRSKLQWSKDNITGQYTYYAYDAGGRLLTATQAGGTTNNTYTYAYDADGNRLTAVVTGSNPASQTLTYNPANQITTTGYGYDGAGNLTTAPGTTYSYNGAEQMSGASVTVGSTTTTTSYTYAGASQTEVLSEIIAGGHTYHLTYGITGKDGNPVIEQVNASGGVAYLTNDAVTGQPLMLSSSSNIAELYVDDGEGNPVALISDFYSVAFSLTYDPYGAATLTGGGTGNGYTQNPFLFKGGIQDRTTGLVKFGNRWYNPTTGTWTQEDTLDAPLDPANANRYAYAADDPINNIDPLGISVGSTTCGVEFLILAILVDGALAVAGIPSAGATWALGAIADIFIFEGEQAVCGSL